jgi:hypothetical protein
MRCWIGSPARLTTARHRGRLVALPPPPVDFFELSDEGKAQMVLLALSQGESFQLAGSSGDGQRTVVTCDIGHIADVLTLFQEAVLPAYLRDSSGYLTASEEGIRTTGARPNLVFFSDERGSLRDPESEGAWGCIHIAEQAWLPTFCSRFLGMSDAEGQLLAELCFGLEAGTTWAIYRDDEGGVCGTPITSEGCFREVSEELRRGMALSED